MRNRKKVLIESTLLIISVLSALELILFILLKAGLLLPAFNPVYNLLINRYYYILDIVNALTLAYIMSYIFYIVALIPERRKQKSITKYVNIYLINILRLLEEIIQISYSFRNLDNKKLSNSPQTNSVLNRTTGRYDFMTYKEHFINFYNQFNEEYQHLSHYIAFIDDDLRDCLYELVTSDFIYQIKTLLVNTNNNDFDNIFEDSFNSASIEELIKQLRRLS